MDMIRDIQDCAERILEVLSHTDELNILRLAESLGERSILTYQALGWLAREGRVRYTQMGTRVFVSLEGGGSKDRPTPELRTDR
jgi:hypothetical protein